jgi:hypothetical protein
MLHINFAQFPPIVSPIEHQVNVTVETGISTAFRKRLPNLALPNSVDWDFPTKPYEAEVIKRPHSLANCPDLWFENVLASQEFMY